MAASRLIRLLFAAPLLACLSLPATFQPASAHAILLASTPALGGSVATGTVALDLRYNSRIDAARSRLTLTRPDHAQTVLTILPDTAPDELRANVALTPGSYVLRWQVLAVDGHITRGDVPFTVTGP